eukprot:80201-Pyramimonas_sp.AAC.1
MRLDIGPDLLHVDVDDASPASTMRCIADVSAMRRDPPTPSTPTPSRRPLCGLVGTGYGGGVG